MPNNDKNLQSEIKDIVISKLLDQVCIQYKDLLIIKEENKYLKGKLTTLCKRMISSSAKTSYSSIKDNTILTPKKNLSIKTNLTTHNRSNSKSRQSSIEIAFKSKSPAGFGKNDNIECKSDRFARGDINQINETQSMFMSTRDKINSSYGLSLDSTFVPNGSFSPKQIKNYYQYQKRKQLSAKKSTDLSDSASDIKGKKMRIVKGMNTFEKIDEKNQIKVTMVKSRKKYS